MLELTSGLRLRILGASDRVRLTDAGYTKQGWYAIYLRKCAHSKQYLILTQRCLMQATSETVGITGCCRGQSANTSGPI